MNPVEGRLGTLAWALTLAVAASAAAGCDSSATPDAACSEVANVEWEGCPPAGAPKISAADETADYTVLWGLRFDGEGISEFTRRQHLDRAARKKARYLSSNEIRERYGAPATEVALVSSYLEQRDIGSELDASGAFLITHLSAGEIESLLQTTLSVYEVTLSDGSKVESVRVDRAPVLPAELEDKVTSLVGLVATHPVGAHSMTEATETPTEILKTLIAQVAGTATCVLQPNTDLTEDTFVGSFSGTPDTCSASSKIADPPYFTPTQLNAVYGIDKLHAGVDIIPSGKTTPETVVLKGDGTTAALIGGPIYYEDYKSLLACFSDYFTSSSPIKVVYHGEQPASGTVGLEGIQDLQGVLYAAPEVDQVDYFATDLSSTADLMTSLSAILKLAPDVTSSSWGWPVAPTSTLQNLIASLAAAGITWMQASGDNGFGAEAQTVIAWSDVTTVGATGLVLNTDNTVKSQEPWNTFVFPWPTPSEVPSGSGGGFVSNTAQPSFQTGTPGIDRYKSAERLTPDIAALGSNVGASIYAPSDHYTPYTYSSGDWAASSGTSFATPYMASAALLLAQASKVAGKGRLGNLNDYLYAAAKGKSSGKSTYDTYFSDITAGNTWNSTNLLEIATTSALTALVKEFFCYSQAHTGYDMPSGLGAIKMDAFVNVVTGQADFDD